MKAAPKTLKPKRQEEQANFISWRFALLCGCILLALGFLLGLLLALQFARVLAFVHQHGIAAGLLSGLLKCPRLHRPNTNAQSLTKQARFKSIGFASCWCGAQHQGWYIGIPQESLRFFWRACERANPAYGQSYAVGGGGHGVPLARVVGNL